MVILPLSDMCFMVLKRFVYTIAVDVYTFRLAFSGKSHRILRHFTLRLAPKRTAFSTKTHSILLQIAPKLVQMAALSNKNSFCRMHMPPLFCIKTNLRENRFFAARLAIGDEKGSHNVKIFTKN